MSGRIMFGGVEIVQSNLVPKKPRFVLADTVPVTQAFRDDFNRWAREFFGEDEQVLLMNGKAFLSPEGYAKVLMSKEFARNAMVVGP